MKHILHTRSGMTLVEVLVAVGISTVVMGAVVAFEVNVFQYQRSIAGSFNVVQNAETILRNVARDIRIASPGEDGSYAIAQAGSTTLTFFADINGDGTKERVRYSLNNTTLSRAVTVPSGSPLSYSNASESTSTVLVNVRNASSTPLFEYFNASYDGSQSPLVQPVTSTNVRLVKINVKLEVALAHGTSSRLYSTQVSFRNVKDNL